ncbi:GntR family transcriptional regulator [Halobacillus fulvus]|nr:GntR family transcriptional regulator [Halobacillus fulvus]
MLNKKSPLPMYYQIEEDLKQKMSNGDYAPGDVIPSERELSELYRVSRMTVRQAITNLVNEDILYREKGKGTFVAEQKIEQPLQGLTSFTEDMKQRGMEASSRLIGFDQVEAPADVFRKLELNEGETVFRIQRIRYADEKPMAIETSFVPSRLVPDLTEDIVSGSLYQYVEGKLGYTIEKATQMIEATVADSRQSEWLEVPLQSAILYIERKTLLTNGLPFEVVKSAYRADRYKFVSDIYRG